MSDPRMHAKYTLEFKIEMVPVGPASTPYQIAKNTIVVKSSVH